MSKKSIQMNLVNPNAAGIDIGSRSHYVAINQNREDVKEFGVYAEDLKELVDWLLHNKVKSVAMESTGSYWQNLYSELINLKFAVEEKEIVLSQSQYEPPATIKQAEIAFEATRGGDLVRVLAHVPLADHVRVIAGVFE